MTTTYTDLIARLEDLRAEFRYGQLIPAPADYAAAYRNGARDMKERCALVARGFDGAINSKQNKAFVDAGVMWEVYGRDIAIAAAIDAMRGLRRRWKIALPCLTAIFLDRRRSTASWRKLAPLSPPQHSRSRTC